MARNLNELGIIANYTSVRHLKTWYSRGLQPFYVGLPSLTWNIHDKIQFIKKG